MTEWVEVEGRTVKAAIAAGLAELGLDSEEAAEIEVLREPERGFLGLGGSSALVRVKARPKKRRRRRGGGKEGDRNGAGGKRDRSGRNGGSGRSGQSRPKAGKEKDSRQPRPQGGSQQATRNKKAKAATSEPALEEETAVTVDIEEQARVVEQFLTGLLDAFGLEGSVKMRVEDEVIFADLAGDQTEALIGPKGSVMQAVLELLRTVVHRKTQAGARVRLDIGGYAERRREALRIYATRLAEQVRADGGEIMLEPMNPADRKVVHDAVAEIDGVRSYSEGEEPERSVVVAAEE